MFERGVAAARGGQKRVAAVLLARAVQLDPQHEMGWLWLSGVLDQPEEIAFCLRSVLALNPSNERAIKGLAWLEQRQMIAAAPIPAAAPEPAPESPAPEPAPTWRRWAQAIPPRISRPAAQDDSHALYHGESWWVNWRRSRRAMGRARLVFWMVPVLLLALTLALNIVLRGALERNVALAQEAAARIAATPVPAPIAAPPADILLSELPPARDARVLAYLSALEEPRGRLRDAVESYRNATSQPGGSSTAHAAAARRLREQVDVAYRTIEALTPPPPLEQAHADYLAGLALERSALDEMLSFYGSFKIELANHAALQMDAAAQRLEDARQAFDDQRAAVAAQPVQPQSAR
ncbi:MAG: hypothetical protein RLZZ387_3803 [Chloroflexota bacterium]